MGGTEADQRSILIEHHKCLALYEIWLQGPITYIYDQIILAFRA